MRITLPERRRGAAALSSSVALHALMLLVLLAQTAGRAFGLPGQDPDGLGIQVSLVDGFAGGNPTRGAEGVKARDPIVRQSPSEISSDAVPLHSVESQTPQELAFATKAMGGGPAGRSLAKGREGDAGGSEQGSNSAKATSGGRPTGSADLLRQIARCLPPDFRPRLAFSQIRLAFGAKGELIAAPNVSSPLPRLTAGDRLAADRIVQAALQCGPYRGAEGTQVALAADFSGIGGGFEGLGGGDGGRTTTR